MNRLLSLRLALLLPALLLVWPVAAQQQPQAPKPLLALDLPLNGGLGATAAATYERLRSAGEYDLWWLKVFEPSHQGRKIAAYAANAAATNTREVPNLLEYVSGGGGLVLIADPSGQWRRDNAALLTGLDVQITDVKGQTEEVSIREHPVMQGIDTVSLRPPARGLQSGSLDTLVTQGGQPLALAGPLGRGRVVVLLAPLVAASDPNRAPEAYKVQLLAQALKWAADTTAGVEGAGTVTGPAPAASGAAAAAALAQKAFIDLSPDERLKPAAAALQAALAEAGLPAETLAYKKDTQTLVQATEQRPALLVIGPYREYDPAETAAVSEYLHGGGSLLVLGYARDDTVKQLAALNRLLGEFGIAVTYGRPAGEAQVREHPVTAGLSGLTRLPAGSAVWAFGEWPLVNVGRAAAATAHQIGRGRAIVLDAACLLPPTEKGAADTSPAVAKLLLSGIRWLTGK